MRMHAFGISNPRSSIAILIQTIFKHAVDLCRTFLLTCAIPYTTLLSMHVDSSAGQRFYSGTLLSLRVLPLNL